MNDSEEKPGDKANILSLDDPTSESAAALDAYLRSRVHVNSAPLGSSIVHNRAELRSLMGISPIVTPPNRPAEPAVASLKEAAKTNGICCGRASAAFHDLSKPGRPGVVFRGRQRPSKVSTMSIRRPHRLLRLVVVES
ncbi:MAG: hypothetical protein WBX25_25865 [Rhodomicrobium sp.]